jgi:predicted nucleic acid-binding protein
MQLQPEQRSRLLCRVIIFELSKFPFLSLSFLANFFEKGNKSLNELAEEQISRAMDLFRNLSYRRIHRKSL